MLPPVDPARLGVPGVVEMGSCCRFVHGYASKVITVAEDGCSLPVELPCDEASDILAVNCCPTKTKRDAYVSVVSPLEVETNQGPISGVQWELPVGQSHICLI